MTESSKYKFHEIMEYVKIKHIAVGTKLISDEGYVIKVISTLLGLSLKDSNDEDVILTAMIINSDWKVIEDKFYLIAPEAFGNKYLSAYKVKEDTHYQLMSEHHRTAFTREQINQMGLEFDISFFKEKEVGIDE